MIAELLLIGSLSLIIYNCFLYPLGIYFLANLTRPGRQIDDRCLIKLPSVSVVIAAYNEELVIGEKIENTLQLNYPRELIQVLVVSDGSNDNTPKIVSSYADRGIIGIHKAAREGKSAAINRALPKISGDIIVFSDANNNFSSNTIRELVKHFVDPGIGAVTGAKRISQNRNRESATGDGLYWKYEAIIKKAESMLGSVTAAEGEILAVRKDLMKPINPNNINDDAAITFDLVKKGYRVVYEENAVSTEEASSDLADDFNVKVRMTAGGFQTIANEISFLLNPFNWFAFTFFSHKILRWLTPHFMILIFISNLFLLDQSIYKLLFLLQLVFYCLSYIGWYRRKSNTVFALFYLPMYFTFMNIALIFGFIAFLKGSQGVNWKKASR